ncbi:MAG TPA: DUF4388 domain-containing protein [Polyangiaceae bacterium]|nr:DUF4388 domain-containing protein [Polyangiaceae bacterium]
MPRISSPGGAWSEEEKARLARELMSGALTVSEACARHGLSQECLREWVLMFRHSAIEAFDEHLRQTLAPQGIAVGDSGGAGFNGSLSDLSLADLIQTLTLARRDGVITISQHGAESRIWCADGEIVDAQSGRLSGELALYRALALTSGRLSAEFAAVSRARTICESTSALLLNGARRMDEVHALLGRLGEGRFRLAFEPPSEAGLAAAELALLGHFRVPSTLQELLAATELGDLEALTGVARLIERGWLSADAEPSPAPVASRVPGALSTAPILLSVLRPPVVDAGGLSGWRKNRGAALVGLLALGGIGWLSLDALRSSAGAPAAAAALAPPKLEAPPVEPGAAPPSSAPPSSALAPGSVAAAPADTPSARREPAPAGPAGAPLARRRRAALPEPTPAAAESTAPRAPRMQIIDEQTPRIQIVE